MPLPAKNPVLGRLRFCPGSAKRVVSSSKRLDRSWGTPNLLFSRYWGSFLAVKEQGRAFNHLPPYSAYSEWSHTSAPAVCLHGVHIDFTLTFTICVCVCALYFSVQLLFEIFFSPINIYRVTRETFALTHLDPSKCPSLPVCDQKLERVDTFE